VSPDDRRDTGGRIDAGGGLGARQWLLVVCGVLLLLFFVLNLQKVKVHLLIATVQIPLVIALAIAAVLGWLLGWAVPRLRRRGTRDAAS
jgi:uncharacterized integral membrane protein